MNQAWMRAVNQADESKYLVVEQLAELKTALKSALNKRDWPAVCRADRLSAQIVNNLEANNSVVLQGVVAELTEIKILYQHSICLIEKELTDLSNQAF